MQHAHDCPAYWGDDHQCVYRATGCTEPTPEEVIPMCKHTAVLLSCLEGCTETGAPIYAPVSPAELAAILEHNLTCYAVADLAAAN